MKRGDQAAIRTAWTDNGDGDAQSLKDHLLEVHRRYPGFTESCAGSCTDAEGRTSYDWLCDAAVEYEDARVLDLACGSGVLLSLMRDRIPNADLLVGLDMSAAELDLARRRLDERDVDLHEGVAQDLSFAASGSFDTVLCHWALTLMDPVEPVLSEVGRILAGGGAFAAIVDGDPAEAPGYSAVHDLVFKHVRAEAPSISERDLGDPRVRKPVALEALARSAFPEANVLTQMKTFALQGEPRVLAEEAAGFFYAAFILSKSARAILIDELAALFTEQAEGCLATFYLPTCRLLVRTPMG